MKCFTRLSRTDYSDLFVVFIFSTREQSQKELLGILKSVGPIPFYYTNFNGNQITLAHCL